MASLKTKFIGLELKSPVIAGSCGLTAELNKLKEIELNGAGAVILKSVFEEQINMEVTKSLSENSYPEEADYIQNYVRANTLQQYINLVKEAKASLKIPVIASINCLNDGEWVSFARELEQAGADAIELNVFILPLDEFTESADLENIYYNVLKHVKSVVKIPVIMKLSPYFTNLPALVSKLKAYGADAVTLFNRFYEPDIDINEMTIGSAPIFSRSSDLKVSLRWTGILAGKDKMLEISSSTGVHQGEDVVKLLLSGATTVQVCSAMYEQGYAVIRSMNSMLGAWMDRNSFEAIEDFRGKMSYADPDHAARYERAQFMKYFSNRK